VTRESLENTKQTNAPNPAPKLSDILSDISKDIVSNPDIYGLPTAAGDLLASQELCQRAAALERALLELSQYFTNVNHVPVEQATITAKLFNYITKGLKFK